jgi:hypothetical protein
MAGIILGCGPAKELPELSPTPRDSQTSATETNTPVPARSDPECQPIVERAIKSITGDRPEHLATGKLSRAIAKGKIQFDTKPQMTGTKRELTAVWPSEARCTYEFEDGTAKQTTGFRYPLGWLVSAGPPPQIGPHEIARVMLIDVMAQHWLLLGTPLNHPGAVFFAPGKKKIGDKSSTTIKLAFPHDYPDLPVYLIAFDDETGLPVRIEYSPIDIRLRKRVTKVTSASDHEVIQGLKLPRKLEMRQDELLAEQWTIEKWEFPDKLDPSLFEAPK